VEPLVFSQGEELALDEASHRLVENAYTRVDLVMDRGEFAVRGGIIDVFPPTLPHPVRIEFFGDEIDTIKESIQKVSDQRSALGAVQNRLEHTISNLDNVVENTTSAESRIRDTDMAEEMVAYSKNNILQQAGQSMLAQANQANQGVLSLLQ
jgi:transcription-repair coupling factor (superfamily II helicase)